MLGPFQRRRWWDDGRQVPRSIWVPSRFPSRSVVQPTSDRASLVGWANAAGGDRIHHLQRVTWKLRVASCVTSGDHLPEVFVFLEVFPLESAKNMWKKNTGKKGKDEILTRRLGNLTIFGRFWDPVFQGFSQVPLSSTGFCCFISSFTPVSLICMSHTYLAKWWKKTRFNKNMHQEFNQ